MDEFFDQGSDEESTAVEEAGEIPDAPELELVAPDRTRSNSPPIKGWETWATTVYSLSVTRDALKFIVDRLAQLKCPCDPLCVSQNICNAVQGLIITIFSVVLQLAIYVSSANMHGKF